MSIIDVSDEITKVSESCYTVFYEGKCYQYFTSIEGAKAFLEVLKNGTDGRTEK